MNATVSPAQIQQPQPSAPLSSTSPQTLTSTTNFSTKSTPPRPQAPSPTQSNTKKRSNSPTSKPSSKKASEPTPQSACPSRASSPLAVSPSADTFCPQEHGLAFHHGRFIGAKMCMERMRMCLCRRGGWRVKTGVGSGISWMLRSGRGIVLVWGRMWR